VHCKPALTLREGNQHPAPQNFAFDLGDFIIYILSDHGSKQTHFVSFSKSASTNQLVGSMENAKMFASSWFLHQEKGGERFAFAFESSVGVSELRIEKKKGPALDSVIERWDLDESHSLVLQSKAMEAIPHGGGVGAPSFWKEEPYVKPCDTAPLTMLTGVEWKNELSLYEPETRKWDLKTCSGILPPGGNNMTLVSLGRKDLIMVLIVINSAHSGSVFFLNVDVAFFSNVSFGSLRQLGSFSKHQGTFYPVAIRPGVVLFQKQLQTKLLWIEQAPPADPDKAVETIQEGNAERIDEKKQSMKEYSDYIREFFLLEIGPPRNEPRRHC